MSKTVRFDLDLANPPPLTAQQMEELEALKKRSDDEIDYSDIPPLDDAFKTKAVHNPHRDPARRTARRVG